MEKSIMKAKLLSYSRAPDEGEFGELTDIQDLVAYAGSSIKPLKSDEYRNI